MVCLLICWAALAALAGGPPSEGPAPLPVHRGITCTVFWVGEQVQNERGAISNSASAWDDEWLAHYGGIDDPALRTGYLPSAFTPEENPFYCALPYNDFDQGKRRTDAAAVVPWAGAREWGDRESMCKNQWVKIAKGDKVAYAQWEDVGPFRRDDSSYVFGAALPANEQNQRAGLDVSPAVRDYLGLAGLDVVDWQFVLAADVPDGPWRAVVTTSQITWR